MSTSSTLYDSPGSHVGGLAPDQTETKPARMRGGWTRFFFSVETLPFIFSVSMLIGITQYSPAMRSAKHLLKTVIHPPEVLVDEVPSIPARTWCVIPVNVPYSGIVTVGLNVLRGNPIDVFLTTSEVLNSAKEKTWGKILRQDDFDDANAMVYSRTDNLPPRNYLLIMRGTPSKTASLSTTQVSVRVQVRPY